jgi:hypothetical protein
VAFLHRPLTLLHYGSSTLPALPRKTHPDHAAGCPAQRRQPAGAVPGGLAREVPQVCCFKIEVPAAAAKLRALIAAGRDAIVGPFDGEEAITLMADLDAGATGTMPSALLPDL